LDQRVECWCGQSRLQLADHHVQRRGSTNRVRATIQKDLQHVFTVRIRTKEINMRMLSKDFNEGASVARHQCSVQRAHPTAGIELVHIRTMLYEQLDDVVEFCAAKQRNERESKQK
jgi:hypothetical protein